MSVYFKLVDYLPFNFSALYRRVKSKELIFFKRSNLRQIFLILDVYINLKLNNNLLHHK